MKFLVLRAQAGDRAALDGLLRLSQSELFAYIGRLVGDRERAADVLQDTFLIVCKQIRWLREPRVVRAWMFRIATREAWRAMRRDRRAHHASLENNEPSDDGGCPSPDRVIDAFEVARLLEKIDALPPNTRALVHLHYLAGLSLRAAADVLEIPFGTAKSRVNYALTSLRRDVDAETKGT